MQIGCAASEPLAVPHRAVEIVKQRALAAGAEDRLHAFVCDITKEPLVPQVRTPS